MPAIKNPTQRDINRREWNRNRRASLRAAGLCISCGKAKNEPGRELCRACLDYQISYNRNRRAEQRSERQRLLELDGVPLPGEYSRSAWFMQIAGAEIVDAFKERRAVRPPESNTETPVQGELDC
jgi:hypothetical protein